MGKCENCYWNDSCEIKGGICEDFFPFDEEKLKIEEYNKDLHMRYSYYERFINEFN